MTIQDAMEYIINEKTGIINHIKKGLSYKLPFPMHIYSAHRNRLLDENTKIIIPGEYSGLGYSYDSPESALISAVGEMIERYCSSYLNKNDLIKNSYNGLKKKNLNVLNPSSITQPFEEQFIDSYNISRELTNDTQFYWVSAYDEIKNENILVPANTIFFDVDADYLYPLIRDQISTGLAAGETKQQAIENATLECVERDAIMITWLNQLSVPLIDPDTIEDESVQFYLRVAAEKGFEVYFLNITTDIGVPTYLVIVKNLYDNFPFIQMGAKSYYDPLEALKGALIEALVGINLLANPNRKKREINNTNDIKEIQDHILYYAAGNGKYALEFLFSGPIQSFDNSSCIDNFEMLKNTLTRKNINLYTYDLTTEDINSLGLHVYRVLTPELAFLEINLPMLKCNRLNEAPKLMGYTPAKVFNKNPHPFP